MEETIVVLARSSEHQKVVAGFGGLLAMSESSSHKYGSPDLFTVQLEIERSTKACDNSNIRSALAYVLFFTFTLRRV